MTIPQRVGLVFLVAASFGCRSHLLSVAGDQPTEAVELTYAATYVPLDGNFIWIGTPTPTPDLCVTLLINQGPGYGGNGDLVLPSGWAINASSFAPSHDAACYVAGADAWPAVASGVVGGDRFPCVLDVDVELAPAAGGYHADQTRPPGLPARVRIAVHDLPTTNYPHCDPI